MEPDSLTIQQKALAINLDPTTYGCFAEIGGGQEVSRFFFLAGGASGTVAKSISAYDKAYSDSLYAGEKTGKRYVSKDRLTRILDCEYNELISVLHNTREPSTRFFAFANTVSTLNYRKDNLSHGWLGMRFQLSPASPPNEVIIHVKLLENDSQLQQNTLGVLGINLIYACFYHYQKPNTFLKSLLDNLSEYRVEITMITMTGPDLNYIDNRLLGVQLVKNGMTPAIMFDRYGQVQEPGDMLYKKNVLAFRGSFRPITYAGIDILKTSYAIFKRDEDYDKDNTVSICEITLNNLMEEGNFDEQDFLDRVDLLNGIGQTVMVSNFREFYKMADYLTHFRVIKLRIVIGIGTFLKIFNEAYYQNLKGGILEAFGKLFHGNVKMYVYPSLNTDGSLLTSTQVQLPPSTRHLFNHLIENRLLLDINNPNTKVMNVFSQQVLEKIRHHDESWESMVPRFVAETIKSKRLFGYSANM